MDSLCDLLYKSSILDHVQAFSLGDHRRGGHAVASFPPHSLLALLFRRQLSKRALFSATPRHRRPFILHHIYCHHHLWHTPCKNHGSRVNRQPHLSAHAWSVFSTPVIPACRTAHDLFNAATQDHFAASRFVPSGSLCSTSYRLMRDGPPSDFTSEPPDGQNSTFGISMSHRICITSRSQAINRISVLPRQLISAGARVRVKSLRTAEL